MYHLGESIIIMGIAIGGLENKQYRGDNKHKEEEYCIELNKPKKSKNSLSASDIKKIIGVNYRFMSTIFTVYKNSGDNL